MPSVSLVMLYSRMGGTQSLLIPWRSSILMLPVEAFTMEGSYRGCVKRLHLCPSNINIPYDFFYSFYILCLDYLLRCILLFNCFIMWCLYEFCFQVVKLRVYHYSLRSAAGAVQAYVIIYCGTKFINFKHANKMGRREYTWALAD